MQSPGAVLDEDQHIQPFEQRRLDHQEVAGDDRVSLGGQELPPGRPGPAGRRIDTGGVQDLPHRGSRDRVTEPGQLALDSPVPPGRVLPRHLRDQHLDRPAGAGPSWAPPVGEGPLPRYEVTMPAQDCRRRDRGQLRSPAAADKPRQCRQPEPVGVTPPQAATELPAEHLVLMAEHQQLNILGQLRADQHRQQTEQARHQPVNQRQQHLVMVAATRPDRAAKPQFTGRNRVFERDNMHAVVVCSECDQPIDVSEVRAKPGPSYPVDKPDYQE